MDLASTQEAVRASIHQADTTRNHFLFVIPYISSLLEPCQKTYFNTWRGKETERERFGDGDGDG